MSQTPSDTSNPQSEGISAPTNAATRSEQDTTLERPQSPRVVSDPKFGAPDTEQVEAAAPLRRQGQGTWRT